MEKIPVYAEKQANKFAAFGYAFDGFEDNVLKLVKGKKGAKRFVNSTADEINEVMVYNYDFIDENSKKCGSLREIAF